MEGVFGEWKYDDDGDMMKIMLMVMMMYISWCCG